MTAIQCPHCKAKLNVPEAALGKKGRCPKCQEKFLVQAPALIEEPAASPAPQDELNSFGLSPAPLDEVDPLAASPAPLGDLDPLAQPLPPLDDMPLGGGAMALPTEAAARPAAKGQKKKKAEAKSAGLDDRQKALLVGGGITAAVVVIGGLLYLVGSLVGGGSSAFGQYAVVDSYSAPEPPAEEVPPLDVDYVPAPKKAPTETATPKPVWSVKPDPPAGNEEPADVVGALSPEPSLLLASLGGPYAVGVPPDPGRARRAKALKGPDGKAGNLVSIDKEPHPVLDIRTGKPVGQFHAEASIRFTNRLSPDGRYLASSVVEVERTPQGLPVRNNELVVWERDAEEPACRWPLPAPVLWLDFIAPDRLAVYHTAPKPEFVVLDVKTGTPVVTAPLEYGDFSANQDHLSPQPALPWYRVHAMSGAVSPGRKLIALGGAMNIVLLAADGKVVGKLPVERVYLSRNYLGMSFNEDGTQLRTLIDYGGGKIQLRVWSLTDGQPLHKPVQYPVDPRDGHAGMLDFLPPLQILTGPEPNSLIVGDRVVSLTAGQAYAELPYKPQRLLDANRLLALGTIAQADNADELSATADFVPRGKSLIVAAVNREELLAKAPKATAGAVAKTPSGPPPPTPADRSKITAIRLQPPAAWGVKPGAELPRPKGPLPYWPHAFAATEAALITEGFSWIRYDLNTGNIIGKQIDLWPGQSRSTARGQLHRAALTRDGKRLALVDPKDLTRVDTWDITGKRLIGLRPYEDEAILWVGWSADGKLLTAEAGRLSGWDVETGQAAFEVEGKFQWFETGPGAEWVMVMTPARHLFFVDSASGKCLGHIPASPSAPEHSLSPDGKTLVRVGQSNVQVWDLETGKRKSEREAPLVPLALGLFWLSPRQALSHTKAWGEQYPRYYLYDLDAHTHTYVYEPKLGKFQNDSLGRAWMTSQAGGGEVWIAPDVPGGGIFKQTLAFGPGTTIQVEADVLSREKSQTTAEKMAAAMHAKGFKIGPGGWVLRAESTSSDTSSDITDTMGQRVRVAMLNITWRLLDPSGKQAWQGNAGGKFDPFQSKYVVVGSRRTDMAPGGPMAGGSTQVRLDYKGQNAMTAQLEEILEKYWYAGVPTCLVKNGGEYVTLPLAIPDAAKQP